MMFVNMNTMQTAMGDATEREAEQFVMFLEARGYDVDTKYGQASVYRGEEEIDENEFQALLRECFK